MSAPCFIKFLSTPSVWRATRLDFVQCGDDSISIHALRAEGDHRSGQGRTASAHFYPRPPCGGRRWPTGRALCSHAYFYPRPPCGGRQMPRAESSIMRLFLSTPSVWRATGNSLKLAGFSGISIHALRVEGDQPDRHAVPCRFEISIHALRVEGDGSRTSSPAFPSHFYPRPPCGGRPCSACTPSSPVRISIHALRVEGDRVGLGKKGRLWHFYPRPPCGGRQQKFTKYCFILQHKHENLSF